MDEQKGEDKREEARPDPVEMLRASGDEIRRVMNLLEQGSTVSAAMRLAQLRRDIERFINGVR